MLLDLTSVSAEDIDTMRIYVKLVEGIRDFFSRTGFEKAVLGASGGIDSSLVACLAAEALEPRNVMLVSMPSHFNPSSDHGDAQALARNLGVSLELVPIRDLHVAFMHTFLGARGLDTYDNSVTDENVQARIRAVILMMYANDLPGMVLNTCNRSEDEVGYCTQYGDSIGSLAPLGKLWKGQVYELAHFINKYGNAPIPQSVIDKPPSAGLREGQLDTDELPPYPVLDGILQLVLSHLPQDIPSVAAIVDNVEGATEEIVRKVLRLHASSQWKRDQAPPAIEV